MIKQGFILLFVIGLFFGNLNINNQKVIPYNDKTRFPSINKNNLEMNESFRNNDQKNNSIIHKNSENTLKIQSMKKFSKFTVISDAININSNAAFASVAKTYSWPGTGTQDDPYIIENMIINYTKSFPYKNALDIEFTSVYFILRNNIFQSIYDGGVSFYVVYNALIINNTSSNNGKSGFEFTNVGNLAIINNTACFNKETGFLLSYADKTSIIGNIANNNTLFGLSQGDSYNNINILNNTFNFNGQNGIELYRIREYNISIEDNIVQFNGQNGIYCVTCNNIKLANNTISSNNQNGIYFSYLGTFYSENENNEIFKNTIAFNKLNGILLESEINDTIDQNFLFENVEYGINDQSQNVCIFGNTFINNSHNTSQAKGFVQSSDWSFNNIGNYWSDYNGTDNDNNGIGDEPYSIEGLNNKTLFDQLPIFKIPSIFLLNPKNNSIVKNKLNIEFIKFGQIGDFFWFSFDNTGNYSLNSKLNFNLSATEGKHSIQLHGLSNYNYSFIADLIIPKITIFSPSNNSYNSKFPLLNFSVTGANRLDIQIDGVSNKTILQNEFSLNNLNNGMHTITFKASDNEGNLIVSSIRFQLNVQTISDSSHTIQVPAISSNNNQNANNFFSLNHLMDLAFTSLILTIIMYPFAIRRFNNKQKAKLSKTANNNIQNGFITRICPSCGPRFQAKGDIYCIECGGKLY